MSPDNSAPIGASYPSDVFIDLVAELQFAIVAISVAARCHLAEMKRVPPAGKHHQEAHRQALALTARNLAAATEALNEAFASMRDESRPMARLLTQAEKLNTNT